MDTPKKLAIIGRINSFLSRNAELIHTGKCRWIIPPSMTADEVDSICKAYSLRGWIVRVEGSFLNFTPRSSYD